MQFARRKVLLRNSFISRLIGFLCQVEKWYWLMFIHVLFSKALPFDFVSSCKDGKVATESSWQKGRALHNGSYFSMDLFKNFESSRACTKKCWIRLENTINIWYYLFLDALHPLDALYLVSALHIAGALHLVEALHLVKAPHLVKALHL